MGVATALGIRLIVRASTERLRDCIKDDPGRGWPCPKRGSRPSR